MILHKKKLNYKDKIHIAKDIIEHGLAAKYVAKLYSISVRWAQIIAKEYKGNGTCVAAEEKRKEKAPDSL